MLNIRKTVCPLLTTLKATDLFVGTGTDLVSVLAMQTTLSRVFTCEISRTMFELPHECMAGTGLLGKVSRNHSKTRKLHIPEDLSQKVSSAVTETF